MTGRFIAVVGPSGVGKDTVMTALAEACPNIILARRVITRAADAGGEAFVAVSEVEFDKLQQSGAFALHWGAHGLYYGIPATVDADIAAGRDVLANLSRAVLETAAQRFTHFEVISLTAQAEALAARLQARARETAEDIARRLARPAPPLPEGLTIHAADNSGPLQDTVATLKVRLYPAKQNVQRCSHV